MLVLLSALARARIIAADLWAGADGLGFFHGGRGFADDVAGILGRATGAAGGGAATATAKGAGRLMQRLLRDVAQKILEGHEARGAAEDVVANLGFDVNHQLVENLVGLRLVFDERVALAVGPQTDAVTQTVHL